MQHTASRTLDVHVTIDEEGDETRAEALLGLDNKSEIRGHGTSRRNPADEAVPRIGDELAIARALSDLAHQLLGTAAHEIETHTHVPASLSL